jgi:two-component system sensor histidine kinase CiaH
MPDSNKKTIRLVTVIYWALLLYIVAALIWWFISLQKQNREMADLRIMQLNNQRDTPAYQQSFIKIEDEYHRNLIKFIGEGSTFLLLTLIGAWFVYRSVRHQFRLQRQQQNFMMAVTHELKTPISVARLNLETLRKYQLDPEKQKKLISMTLEETERLNTLTNNILISSQLEGSYGFSKEELDLSDLFRDRVREFSQRCHDRPFIEEIEPGIEIKGDTLLLQLLINNLIENAIKYSPKDAAVTCRLFADNRGIHLQVIDKGPGIPEGEKKNIFRKFYRIGNESTRKTQGTGLGLYLCQRVANDYHADISVTNQSPTGSNFEVIFPKQGS